MVIPVPPSKVRVSPVVNVSVPVSPAIEKEPEGIVPQESWPAPSVFRYSPALPSACGQLWPSSTTLPVVSGVIVIFPPLTDVIVLPFTSRFPPS